MSAPPPLPPIKWVGGKRASLPALLPLFPRAITGTYFEPFVGGGAVFFALRSAGRLRGDVVLGDASVHVAALYQGLRDQVEAVLDSLRRLEAAYRHDPEGVYLAERARLNAAVGASQSRLFSSPHVPDVAERAARLIFLNRTGFNGLWRVNRWGRNNVAWGRNPDVPVVHEARLRAVSAALQGVEVLEADFAQTLALAGEGDVVYADPPYCPVSDSSFTGYARDDFSDRDHVRLAARLSELRETGAVVVASNADVPRAHALYARWPRRAVQVRRNVNRDAAKRGAVGELAIGGL